MSLALVCSLTHFRGPSFYAIEVDKQYTINFEVDIPTKTMTEGIQHFDCLIIGAGVCGIDAAYHVQKYSPWANYAVLERSANTGGTWDQFKYPGKLYIKFCIKLCT